MTIRLVAINFCIAIATCWVFENVASAADDVPEPTQDPNAAYRLYRTKNIYTFLKLETGTGRIWQVQWGEPEYRFQQVINPRVLAQDPVDGRFTLYPSSNIYTFLLVDQKSGTVWQVQWGVKGSERFITPIE